MEVVFIPVFFAKIVKAGRRKTNLFDFYVKAHKYSERLF